MSEDYIYRERYIIPYRNEQNVKMKRKKTVLALIIVLGVSGINVC
ncbi:MAG: hypothetical protein ACFFDK_18630 [Promethearchaeota archaeon]